MDAALAPAEPAEARTGSPLPRQRRRASAVRAVRRGKGVGPGSADPIRLTQPGSILTFIAPPHPGSVFAGSEWGGQKVLWFVAPSYRGHVLIRGGRLDGTDPLAFDGGREPPTELTIPRRGPGRLPAGLRARRPALPSVVHPSPQARLLRVPDRRDKLQSDDRFPCRALARPVDRPRGGVGRSPAGRMRTWHASSWG